MPGTSLQKATQEYRVLYLKKYGVELAEKDAIQGASRLIDYFRLFIQKAPLASAGAGVKNN